MHCLTCAEESYGSQPVVNGDDDDGSVRDEVLGVVPRPGAQEERSPGDPHHHWEVLGPGRKQEENITSLRT